MVLTTDYQAVYNTFKDASAQYSQHSVDFLSRAELAIRVDAVVSAALFSPAIYAKFNPDWN